MPAPDTSVPGAPCWIDLMSSDPDASAAFYGELFGWTIDDPGPEYGGYKNFVRDGQQVGGLMKKPDEMAEMPDVWSVYLVSNDAAATVAAAEANGGALYVPVMPVVELGVMAVIGDAGGASVGVWQPKDHRGLEVIAEDGAPAWFELHTRDHDKTVQFYRDVFGWDAHTVGDTDEFRYTTLGQGESARAGVMDATAFLPDGVPPHWSVYFQVADADASLERVAALGGSIVMPAEDTPYGRLAMATDATGAVFKLVADLTLAP